MIAKIICGALDYSHFELSILLTDDASIKELNAQWRAKDKPTDVLSFSQLEGEPFPGEAPCLGDVVISMDTASRQAEKIGHSLEDEFCRLLTHGILHLLGHDHVHGGRQASKMKREESRILAILDKELEAT